MILYYRGQYMNASIQMFSCVYYTVYFFYISDIYLYIFDEWCKCDVKYLSPSTVVLIQPEKLPSICSGSKTHGVG